MSSTYPSASSPIRLTAGLSFGSSSVRFTMPPLARSNTKISLSTKLRAAWSDHAMALLSGDHAMERSSTWKISGNGSDSATTSSVCVSQAHRVSLSPNPASMVPSGERARGTPSTSPGRIPDDVAGEAAGVCAESARDMVAPMAPARIDCVRVRRLIMCSFQLCGVRQAIGCARWSAGRCFRGYGQGSYPVRSRRGRARGERPPAQARVRAAGSW